MIIKTLIFIGMFGLILSSFVISAVDTTNDELVEVSDYVRVDKNIIDGYEGEDYIPRSVSINKKLKNNQNGTDNGN